MPIYNTYIRTYIHHFEYKYLPIPAAADGGYVASNENQPPIAKCIEWCIYPYTHSPAASFVPLYTIAAIRYRTHSTGYGYEK